MQEELQELNTTVNGKSENNLNIKIRGKMNSIQESSLFYIVDGVTIPEATIQINFSHYITSIDILKDAAATATYGSKAAKRAIIITTKKALEALTQVEVKNKSIGNRLLLF